MMTQNILLEQQKMHPSFTDNNKINSMTKEEFSSKYREIDRQLTALKQEYKRELFEKWGIVCDAIPMKIVVKTAFSTEEVIGYIRFVNVDCLGDFSIKISPMKKNGEASKNMVNLRGDFVSIEKLKDE